MIESQEKIFSSKNIKLKRTPISVYILLFICILYAAVQAASILSLISFLLYDVITGDDILYSFISAALTYLPWVCVIIAGVIGLCRRKVWGWAIWLVTSLWFISSSIPIVDVLILNLIPKFEIIAYFIFFLLLTPSVRKWCRVDFINVLSWIFAVLAFFLGWIWCSVTLHEDYLPPNIADINSFMVMCSIICWVFNWGAAYLIVKSKIYGIVLLVLASVLSIATLVISLLNGWLGLQQRVLSAFSTIFGHAGLWISVRDSLSFLCVILIFVNLIAAVMVIALRKKVLSKFEPANKCVESKKAGVSEVEEEPPSERKVGWDVILAGMALIVAGLQAGDLFLMGFGVGGFFILYGAMALSVLGPVAVIAILLRIGRKMEDMKRMSRVLRGILLICLLLVGVFYVLSPGFLMSYLPTDLGMQVKVAATGGLDKLQEWAIDILERPQEEVVVSENSTSIKWDLYSDQVKSLNSPYVFISTNGGDEVKHIKISWGGGFHHWGILVGPSHFKTENNEYQHVYYWVDGVYGYHQIQ